MAGFPTAPAVPLFAGGFKSSLSCSVGFRVSICPVLECSVLGHSVVAPVSLHGGFPHGRCSSPLRRWVQVSPRQASPWGSEFRSALCLNALWCLRFRCAGYGGANLRFALRFSVAAACSNLLCAVMLCGAFGSDVLGTLLRIFTLCFKSSL